MKTFILSCLLLGVSLGAAQAQFVDGADAFASAGTFPPEGGRSRAMDLNTCTLESGEVLAISDMLPNTAWWRWTAVEDGFCVVETVLGNIQISGDTRFYSELGVFTGTTVTSLTKVATGAPYRANNNAPKLGATTRFFAQKGRTYFIQVGATTVTDTRRNVVVTLTPLPTKTVTREAVWTYVTEAGLTDVAALTMVQNVSGTLTGKLRTRSGTYPFTSVLDHLGMATTGVIEKSPKGQPPRGPITLSFPGFKDSMGLVYYPSGFTANAYLYDSLPHAPLPVGNWAGPIESLSHVAVGSVTMKISPSQTASVALRFLDGTVGTHSSRVMSSGAAVDPRGLAMMKILSGGKFAFQASGSFNNTSAIFFDGSGRYIRQEKPGTAFYPTGISTVMSVKAFPFTKPEKGQRALGFLNATEGVGKLRITDPNNELGGDADLPLTLDANNKFVFETDTVRKPTLKLNTTTGQVTGTVILGGKKRNILGTLSNSTTPKLVGYITGTAENVKFEVLP